MKSRLEQEVQERFRTALDLFDLAERMLVQRLRRENPEATDEQLDAAVNRWLSKRPGAEDGDGEGRAIAWPSRE